MLKEPTWWLWTFTAISLAMGLAGYPLGYFCALALSLAQTVTYAVSEPSCWTYPVQVRVAYTVLLSLLQIPFLRWLNWVPFLGTLALVTFGYCLLARLLSLCPWNRTHPLTLDFVKRAISAPTAVRLGLRARSICHL